MQTIDSALTLPISFFHRERHLQPSMNVTGGTVNFWTNGKLTDSIEYNIKSVSLAEKVLMLFYSVNGESVTYSIQLQGIRTNLNNGMRWYFICPRTGQRCTKLIKPIGQDKFYHRTAYKGLIYSCQRRSHKAFNIDKKLKSYFDIDKVQNTLYSKYRKKHYRGKHTPLAKKEYQMNKDIEENNLIRVFELAVVGMYDFG